MNRLLVVVGLLLVGAVIVKSFIKKIADNVDLKSARIRWDSISILSANLNLTVFLSYQNDNSFAINIKDFLGSIIYKNSNIADVRLESPRSLIPHGVTELQFQTKVNSIDLGDEIVSLIKGDKLSDFYLKGSIRVENTLVPVEYKLTNIS